LFKQVDGDGNGRLDLEEVKALLNLETDAEAAAVIQELDIDGDGCLDFDELSDAVMNRATSSNCTPAGSPRSNAAARASDLARAAAVRARKSQTVALQEAYVIRSPAAKYGEESAKPFRDDLKSMAPVRTTPDWALTS